MDLQTEYIRRHFTKSYWKCHNHRRLYRRIPSVGISQKVVEMPHSPTTLQTERVRRHFTESWKIFTGYATITDRINPSVYFQRGFFFDAHFPSVKPSAIFFFTDRLNDGMWYYRWKRCRQTLSIGYLVGKKLTDEVWILHRRIYR
jgi:hypothetical protein